MRRSFPLTLISLTLLVAACNWNPQKRQASVTPSEPDEAVTETVPEEVAEPESTNDGSVLGDILDTEGKTDEEVAQELLKAIFGGLAERRYNTHPDKSIDDILEKWLKEVGVFMGYDYVHDYFDNTGETKTYAGRNVEVWENKKNTVYVDTETGTVLYQKNPKGESTTVKAFSTKVDVSDIASHLPKI